MAVQVHVVCDAILCCSEVTYNQTHWNYTSMTMKSDIVYQLLHDLGCSDNLSKFDLTGITLQQQQQQFFI